MVPSSHPPARYDATPDLGPGTSQMNSPHSYLSHIKVTGADSILLTQKQEERRLN